MKRFKLALKRGGISLVMLVVTTFYPLTTVHVLAETDPTDQSATTTQTDTPPAETQTGGETKTEPSQADPTPPQQTQLQSQAQTQAASQTQTSEPEDKCPEVRGAKRPHGADSDSYHYNAAKCLWENDYYTWDPVTKQKTRKTAYDYVYSPAQDSWEKVTPPQSAALASPNGSSINLNTDISVLNFLSSLVYSGNVSVGDNRNIGGVSSGNALAVANIINLLQSSASFGNGDVSSFTADIQGNVYGDLLLDPALLTSLQGTGANLGGDVDINVQSNALINNDISLDAQSGDANVHDNRNVGSVSTGNADAVLNLINMMNSAITSGDSFIGMLNIYGNLDGDILLPPDILKQLLASNAPTTTLNNSNIENQEILADLNSNQTINNNINLTSTSGNILVADNQNVGSVTGGNATSNLTVLNLTGRQVSAENSLLVFVNVLGSWVGLILDAPAGTTSAALGTGVTNNTFANNENVKLNENSSSTINNNVTLNAASGDANVTDNRNVGSVSTGNAMTSANVVNIMNSNFALSDWFGILFINVFGSWNGSFGVDTMAGDGPIAGGMGGGSEFTANSSNGDMKVFRFVPGSSADKYKLEPAQFDVQINPDGTATLASSTSGSVTPQAATTTKKIAVNPQTSSSANYWIPVIAVLIGVSLLGTERYLSLRQRRV